MQHKRSNTSIGVDIGGRLKEYARLRHGTIKGLAEAIGERPDNLQKYASGKHLAGARLLLKLASDGLNVHWLVTGVGNMYASEDKGEQLMKLDRDMLALLKSVGIIDSAQLKAILSEIRQMIESTRVLNMNLQKGSSASES